tara:strand:+ start:22343 stop:22954 length:612 start_codon:yes stop_codon:yes gene_type:complete
MDPTVQHCELQIKDVVINNQGLIALANKTADTANSVKPLVRLAPRRFTLGTAEHQMVKLLYRRKPGIDNGEYQGVLAIKCTEQTENRNLPVTIIPALVHNVPVIVRTGRLPLQAEFGPPTISNNILNIDLKISGRRSLTGDIVVINADSGEVVAQQKHLSVYSQHPLKKLQFALGNYQNTPLQIKLTEDPRMGGDLVIQKLIK